MCEEVENEDDVSVGFDNLKIKNYIGFLEVKYEIFTLDV